MNGNPARRAGLIALPAAGASLGFAQSVLVSLMPVLVEASGLGLGTLGVVIAAGTAALALCAPLWGQAADRHGALPPLRLALVGVMLAHLLFGAVVLAASRGLDAGWVLTGLLAARLLHGVCAGGVVPLVQAATAALTDVRGRLGGFARLSVAQNVARLLGFAATAALVPLAPLAPLALLPLASWGARMTLPRGRPGGSHAAPPPAAPQPRGQGFLRSREALIALCMGGALGAVQHTGGMMLVDRLGLDSATATRTLAAALMVTAVFSAGLQLSLQRARQCTERARALAATAMGAAAVTGCLWTAALLPSLVVFGVAATVLATANSAAASLRAPHGVGRRVGSVASAQTAGYALGAVCGGFAYALGPVVPLALSAGWMLLAGVAAGAALKRAGPNGSAAEAATAKVGGPTQSPARSTPGAP